VKLAVKPEYSTHIADPYVTNVYFRNEKYHDVVAWADVNNPDTLAALDGVRRFGLLELSGFSSDEMSNSRSLPISKSVTPMQKAMIPITILCGALMVAGLLIVIFRQNLLRKH
jgi:hypothetical protein